ncbi:MAG: heliorhodopsin HeR [Chloroflexi bacterium]|nr:heliorhodopsin HeR [Chloroflexota bacterium]
MSTNKNEPYSKLRRFNLIMGFLHLIQGVFMWVVSNDTTYPVFTNFLSFDTTTFSLSPQAKLFYELPLGPSVAIFLLLSAVAHFYLSSIGYSSYVDNLNQNKNPIRFYEYALSSSLTS